MVSFDLNSDGNSPIEGPKGGLLIESASTADPIIQEGLYADKTLHIDVARTSSEALTLLEYELYECIVISEEIMGEDAFKLVAEKKIRLPSNPHNKKDSCRNIRDSIHLWSRRSPK